MGGGAREREGGRETIENQSIIILLNEEGTAAPFILLIRLSIPPERPNPGRSEQTQISPGTRSLLTSPPPAQLGSIPSPTEGRLHHSLTVSSYLFAYKPSYNK